MRRMGADGEKAESGLGRRERSRARDRDEDSEISGDDERARGERRRASRDGGKSDREGEAERNSGRRRTAHRGAEPDHLVDDGNETGRRRDRSGRRLEIRIEQDFQRFDKDGDGAIDVKEFELGAVDHLATASRRFFKRFDADGDGRVTKAEIDRAARERSPRPERDGGNAAENDASARMRPR
jgi:hypothetical protein